MFFMSMTSRYDGLLDAAKRVCKSDASVPTGQSEAISPQTLSTVVHEPATAGAYGGHP